MQCDGPFGEHVGGVEAPLSHWMVFMWYRVDHCVVVLCLSGSASAYMVPCGVKNNPGTKRVRSQELIS